jgi:hypothetical protein
MRMFHRIWLAANRTQCGDGFLQAIGGDEGLVSGGGDYEAGRDRESCQPQFG